MSDDQKNLEEIRLAYASHADMQWVLRRMDDLRQMIVESANACALKGCEHCKWLGWHLGRYESLDAAGRLGAMSQDGE